MRGSGKGRGETTCEKLGRETFIIQRQYVNCITDEASLDISSRYKDLPYIVFRFKINHWCLVSINVLQMKVCQLQRKKTD